MPEQNTNKNENPTNVKQPVVVIMGHVDHGKTSILEVIRNDFALTAKESGGITQHIGAYEAEFQGKKITFIDTPGHEAFSAMRERGAKVADIAVLVIDACEGMKPQTKEALAFIKATNIPFVIALNKIDKPEADAEKVKNELHKEAVTVESWGGKVPCVKTSAKTKQGINELLETIWLLWAIENIKPDLDHNPEAVVIESSLDAKRGTIATIIAEKGIFQTGQIVATKSAFGKIKKMMDFKGKEIEQLLPGQAAKLLGLEMPPLVGEKLCVYANIESAKGCLQSAPLPQATQSPVADSAPDDKPFLNLFIKADVYGSLEAICNVLQNINQEKVALRIIKTAVGEITASDIKEAETMGAIILAFRLKIDPTVENFARQKRVKIKNFDVIYEMVQGIRMEMEAVLAPDIKRVDLAKIKIIAYFKKSKQAQIIGGRILEGEVTQNTMAEIVRNEEVIGKGKIKSLEKEKKQIGKAGKGEEIGIMFSSDVKIELGDILQVFREERTKGIL